MNVFKYSILPKKKAEINLDKCDICSFNDKYCVRGANIFWPSGPDHILSGNLYFERGDHVTWGKGKKRCSDGGCGQSCGKVGSELFFFLSCPFFVSSSIYPSSYSSSYDVPFSFLCLVVHTRLPVLVYLMWTFSFLTSPSQVDCSWCFSLQVPCFPWTAPNTPSQWLAGILALSCKKDPPCTYMDIQPKILKNNLQGCDLHGQA